LSHRYWCLGTDLYGRPSLELLLRALRDTQIPWIRLMYVNPTFITEKLLLAWKDTGRVLPYFDIPVQSGSDKVLGRCVEATTEIRFYKL